MTITSDTSAILKIQGYLPKKISGALMRLDKSVWDKISELRIRQNAVTTVTINGENCLLCLSGITKNPTEAIITSKEELDDMVYRLCKGSVYSHEATLEEFYITVDGIRIGLGGELRLSSSGKETVGNILSVNIRLPKHIEGICEKTAKYICEKGIDDGKGLLIISPPGVGKTTHLRDLAKKLSFFDRQNPSKKVYRVAVIDERREIYMKNIFENCCIDFICGVEKIKAMEIATRVLSPQIIVCDEIATPAEAEKIIRHRNTGTLFIASLHSDSVQNALKMDFVKAMVDKDVFGAIYCLYKTKSGVSGELYIKGSEQND